ncbi:MAG: hypothetical protein ACJ73S_08795 [Mycobacteriales bacterium]
MGERRLRWVARENERRQQEYRHRLLVWQADRAALDRLRAQARMFPGPGAIPAAGVELDRDETVTAAYAGISLIEVDRPAGAYSPEAHGGFSYRHAVAVRPVPGSSGTLRDQGTVTITTRRVVFVGGRGRREWAFGELAGIEHHLHRPATFLHVPGGRAAGLSYPAELAVELRLRLECAATAAAGRLGGLLADLDRQRGELAEPEAPVPAGPTDAPDPRRWPWVAAAGLAVIALAAASQAPALRHTADSRPAAAPHHALAAPATPSPTPSPSPPPPPPTTVSPRSKPAPAARVTTARPAAAPVPRCGAPPNPIGFTFCPGTLVTRPDPRACVYFACVRDFRRGDGYLIQCRDGQLSMSGGIRGSCSHHGGDLRPVYLGPP